MDNTSTAQASTTDNEDQQANATSHTAEPSDDASPTQNGPSASTAEAGVTQSVSGLSSAPNQQLISLVGAFLAEEETPVRFGDLLAVSEDLRTFDVRLHNIERACTNFMRDVDRTTLAPDVRAAVAWGDQVILRFQQTHALESIAIVSCTAELAGASMAVPTLQDLQLALYRLDVSRRALISMRGALVTREFQLWVLGEDVFHAEVQHDMMEWALLLTQTTTRFISRRPWLAPFIGELSSLQSLDAACIIDVEAAPPPTPQRQEQDQPATEEHAPRDLDGDCMVCTLALTVPETNSTGQSPSLLATCQTCKQALHLRCVLTWWRMPVTLPQARKCPLCRSIVTDRYYIAAVRRYTAWMFRLMDDAGNGN